MSQPHLRLSAKHDARTGGAQLKRGAIRAAADGGAPKGLFAGQIWGKPTAEDRSRPRRVTADMVRSRTRQIRAEKLGGFHETHVTPQQAEKFSLVQTRELSPEEISAHKTGRFGVMQPGLAKNFGRVG